MMHNHWISTLRWYVWSEKKYIFVTYVTRCELMIPSVMQSTMFDDMKSSMILAHWTSFKLQYFLCHKEIFQLLHDFVFAPSPNIIHSSINSWLRIIIPFKRVINTSTTNCTNYCQKLLINCTIYPRLVVMDLIVVYKCCSAGTCASCFYKELLIVGTDNKKLWHALSLYKLFN